MEKVGVAEHAAVEDDDDDEELESDIVLDGLVPSFGGPPIGSGYGFGHDPVQGMGHSGNGVTPPQIPTSRGKQPSMIPPISKNQVLIRLLQRDLSPDGPTTG